MIIEGFYLLGAIFLILFFADMWKGSAVFGLIAGIVLAIMGVAIIADGLQVQTGSMETALNETATLTEPVYSEAPEIYNFAFKDFFGILTLLLSLYIMMENGARVAGKA